MRDLKKEFQGVTGEIAAKWETMQAALNKLHKVRQTQIHILSHVDNPLTPPPTLTGF
jgi:hypothetical protein